MNKSEFITDSSDHHKCTKVEAEKVIGMSTSSVIDALEQGKDLSLVGFGYFTVAARLDAILKLKNLYKYRLITNQSFECDRS